MKILKSVLLMITLSLIIVGCDSNDPKNPTENPIGGTIENPTNSEEGGETLTDIFTIIGIALIFFSIRPIIAYSIYYFKLFVLKKQELKNILSSINEKNWFSIKNGRIGRRQFALRTSIIGMSVVVITQTKNLFVSDDIFIFVLVLILTPLLVTYIIQIIKRLHDIDSKKETNYSTIEVILIALFFFYFIFFKIISFSIRLTIEEGSKKDNIYGKTRYRQNEIVSNSVEVNVISKTEISEIIS